jgi:regulator of replication initiation timing
MIPKYSLLYLQLEETKKVLGDEVTRLKEKLEKVTTERNELKIENKNLGFNISTLYKTAIAEIERKDKLIAQLRRE